jgi:hypothetical protein
MRTFFAGVTLLMVLTVGPSAFAKFETIKLLREATILIPCVPCLTIDGYDAD